MGKARPRPVDPVLGNRSEERVVACMAGYAQVGDGTVVGTRSPRRANQSGSGFAGARAGVQSSAHIAGLRSAKTHPPARQVGARRTTLPRSSYERLDWLHGGNALSGLRGAGVGTQTACACVVLILAFLATSARSVAAAPVNDAFADAGALTGFPAQASGSLVDATAEAGEPSHYGNEWLAHTAWWRWTAPIDRHVAVDICSPHVPTPGFSVAAVYRGDSLSSLTRISTRNGKPLCAGQGWGARGAFFASAGSTYRIAVASYEGRPYDLKIVPAGSVSLGVVQRPEGPRARIFYRSEPGEVNDFVMGVRWDPSVPFSADPLPPPVAFSLGASTRCRSARVPRSLRSAGC